MTATDFPGRRHDLQEAFGRMHDEIPAVTNGFFAMHRASQAEGALPAATKELMALAIAIAVRCDGCIAFHLRDALDAGATRDQVLETIGVAVMMGGGPAMVYGSDAMTALDQFERQRDRAERS